MGSPIVGIDGVGKGLDGFGKSIGVLEGNLDADGHLKSFLDFALKVDDISERGFVAVEMSDERTDT